MLNKPCIYYSKICHIVAIRFLNKEIHKIWSDIGNTFFQSRYKQWYTWIQVVFIPEK